MTILFALLLACAGDGRVDEILALTGDPVAGEAVFDAHCAACHGTAGSGGSGGALSGGDPSGVAEVVLLGEEDMPAFDGDLDDQEIADVVAYVTEVL